MQTSIKRLLGELEEWARGTLSGNVVPDDPDELQQARFERERLLLQMHYWSTKILITRPCLCRTERRIKDESDASARFNSETATDCVNSAHQLTALFLNEPDCRFIYEKAPWWNIVHISRYHHLSVKQLVLTEMYSHAMRGRPASRDGI